MARRYLGEVFSLQPYCLCRPFQRILSLKLSNECARLIDRLFSATRTSPVTFRPSASWSQESVRCRNSSLPLITEECIALPHETGEVRETSDALQVAGRTGAEEGTEVVDSFFEGPGLLVSSTGQLRCPTGQENTDRPSNYPAYIIDELWLLLDKVLEGQTGPHIDNAVEQLTDSHS
jgi:hypothetical protein